jgi:hypothetical protein
LGDAVQILVEIVEFQSLLDEDQAEYALEGAEVTHDLGKMMLLHSIALLDCVRASAMIEQMLRVCAEVIVGSVARPAVASGRSRHAADQSLALR